MSGLRVAVAVCVMVAASAGIVAAQQGAGAKDPLQLLAARLAAGEFAPAIDEARTTADPQLKAQMLQQIIRAQQQAGDFTGAVGSARLLPNSEEGARSRSSSVRDRSLRGGGNGANFTELMDLITTTVQPESWDTVGGPGSMSPFNTGIRVDPTGVMRQATKADTTGELSATARRARLADLHTDMARQSGLRMVSLTRLEKAVAERLQAGEPVLESMRRLAGLYRIQYVFLYPEEKEIVIAGPAEGWRYDADGRPVGNETAVPTLDLDDLVVVLRTFTNSGERVFGCSINTRDKNLKLLKEFVEASLAKGPLKPGTLGKWLKDMHERLGMQDVVVYGVPGNTRVSRVLVEADYRMKLIGVGKVDGGAKIPDYFKLLEKLGQTKGNIPMEALRWWMTMKYDAIVRNAEHDAFELQGSSVLVQSENQFVNSLGQHLPTGVSEPTNRLFAENFTKHYDELAQRDPIFADLKGVFDLGMVAALCYNERLSARIGWNMGVFANNGLYQPTVMESPKEVESVMAHRVYRGKDIVVQVAGGVRADLLSVAKDGKLAKENAALKEKAIATKAPTLPEGRWWWDAK